MEKETKKKRRKKKKPRSLRWRINLIILQMTIIMLLVAGIISGQMYEERYLNLSAETMQYIASGMQSDVDAADVETVRDTIMKVYREACEEYGDSFVHDYSETTIDEEDGYWDDYWDKMEEISETEEYKRLLAGIEKYAQLSQYSNIYIAYDDEKTGNEIYLVDVTYEGPVYPGSFDKIKESQKTFSESVVGNSSFKYTLTRDPQNNKFYYGTRTKITAKTGKVIGTINVQIALNQEMKLFVNYLRNLFVQVAFVAIIALGVVHVVINRRIIRPVKSIDEAASSFVKKKKGEDKETLAISDLDIRTGDELETLSDSIKQMEKDINEYIKDITDFTAEKERIGVELGMAREIQASMVPRKFPAFPERQEFDVYASMNPAKEVGGDLYDFFLIDENHLALVIADVSGKGVPAALFMMLAKALIKNTALRGIGPGAVFENVNNQLCENNDANMFVTAWMGILTISTGKMICANAGHEYPVICRAGGKYEILEDEHGFVLAGMEGIPYGEYELNLSPGDRLFVYTDGVPEATDAEEEFFGMERMVEVLNEVPGQSPEDLSHHMTKGIDVFVNGSEQYDDVTMLAFHYIGPADQT